jgi:uncharacterized protein (DUF2252 family)
MGARRALSAGPLRAKLSVFGPRPRRAELEERGKRLRERCPRSEHGQWRPAADRPDPVALVHLANKGRVRELLPYRHGRMLASPFSFCRGSALAMAVDLATTPTTGVRVQACGDAHLVNFRGFATPERRIIFDIHDFDETLPAPWEWDVKRLAASFVLACRDNSLGKAVAEQAVLTCVRSYREHMREYAALSALEVWYASLDPDTLLPKLKDPALRARVERRIAKERARSAMEYDFPSLVHGSKSGVRIREQPPTIYHRSGRGLSGFGRAMRESIARYRESLPEHRRVLLDRYAVKDVALKVVGVGSVGTLCGVVLLMSAEQHPLFLQVKEARASVLEPYAGRSVYANHGQRVVSGHLLMQSASDIFLGWTTGRRGHHLYVRQLRDAKIKPDVESFGAAETIQFADWCGHCLARAHARSGEPAVISGYLGGSGAFDTALAAFATAYADQTERDYDAMRKAARAGHLPVEIER